MLVLGLIGLSSIRTSSPFAIFVPISAFFPLTRIRPLSTRRSASRLEQKPDSLMYLLIRFNSSIGFKV